MMDRTRSTARSSPANALGQTAAWSRSSRSASTLISSAARSFRSALTRASSSLTRAWARCREKPILPPISSKFSPARRSSRAVRALRARVTRSGLVAMLFLCMQMPRDLDVDGAGGPARPLQLAPQLRARRRHADPEQAEVGPDGQQVGPRAGDARQAQHRVAGPLQDPPAQLKLRAHGVGSGEGGGGTVAAAAPRRPAPRVPAFTERLSGRGPLATMASNSLRVFGRSISPRL